MSFELAAYNLNELIIDDWSVGAEEIINNIFSVIKNKNTYQKIVFMSSKYKLKHSNSNYIFELENIISNKK